MKKPSRAPRKRSTASASAFAWHDLRQARARLAVSLVASAIVAALVTRGFGWAVRAVAAWDAFALVNLAVAWWIIARADAPETKRRAASVDPGRHVVWAVVLAACTFSLFAAVVVLRSARRLAPERSTLLVVLCLIAVTGSWALTHTAYTLRYAHLYYRRDEDDDEHGDRENGRDGDGLIFSGSTPPSDFDFAYFAFTIGMCFQVSDVTITSSALRRTVLAHALLAFAYNTAVLALSLNVLFGILS